MTVEATSMDGSKSDNFECFFPADDVDPCSSKSCHSDISAVLTPDIEVEETIKVKVCAEADQANTGAIWEINFSRSNESYKLEGFFVEAARERFRDLQNFPEFNTQLSFVSIVGGRGVGKSTVASLLSGNHSMFEVGHLVIKSHFSAKIHFVNRWAVDPSVQQQLVQTCQLLFQPKSGQLLWKNN